MPRRFAYFAVLLFGFHAAAAGESEPAPSAPPVEMERLAEGVFRYPTSDGANLGAIETPEGWVILGTPTGEFDAIRLRQALDALISLPIHTVIHPDGLSLQQGIPAGWRDGSTRILAHQEAAQNKAPAEQPHHPVASEEKGAEPLSPLESGAVAPSLPASAGGAPTSTFADSMVWNVGGVEIKLLHAEGPRDDLTLVWLPASSILFAGELNFDQYPEFDSPSRPKQPARAWIRSLNQIQETLHPLILVGERGRPEIGAEAVHSALAARVEFLEWMDSTLESMEANAGLGNDPFRSITLPPRLAALPGFVGVTGRLEKAFEGLAVAEWGWRALRTAPWNDLSEQRLATLWAETAGSPEALKARILALREQGRLDEAIYLAHTLEESGTAASGDPLLLVDLLNLKLRLVEDPSERARLSKFLDRMRTRAERGLPVEEIGAPDPLPAEKAVPLPSP